MLREFWTILFKSSLFTIEKSQNTLWLVLVYTLTLRKRVIVVVKFMQSVVHDPVSNEKQVLKDSQANARGGLTLSLTVTEIFATREHVS